MNAKGIVRLIISVGISQMAGVFGSIFTVSSIPTWYATLQKPVWSPPNWLFAPVWLTLYTLMGVSAFLIWNRGIGARGVNSALSVFGVQLVLNALWSFLFFGLRSPFYGLIGIIMLWVAIFLTILRFYRISRNAAILLLPYIIWVSIAMSLNAYVWAFNP